MLDIHLLTQWVNKIVIITQDRLNQLTSSAWVAVLSVAWHMLLQPVAIVFSSSYRYL